MHIRIYLPEMFTNCEAQHKPSPISRSKCSYAGRSIILERKKKILWHNWLRCYYESLFFPIHEHIRINIMYWQYLLYWKLMWLMTHNKMYLCKWTSKVDLRQLIKHITQVAVLIQKHCQTIIATITSCFCLSETNWYNVVVWMVAHEPLNVNMFIDNWSIIVLPSTGSQVTELLSWCRSLSFWQLSMKTRKIHWIRYAGIDVLPWLMYILPVRVFSRTDLVGINDCLNLELFLSLLESWNLC